MSGRDISGALLAAGLRLDPVAVLPHTLLTESD
jgi:hypothetical protein